MKKNYYSTIIRHQFYITLF